MTALTATTPFVINLEVAKGATFTKEFTWKDGNGDVVDLSGWSAHMQARTAVEASATILDLTSGAGDIILAATAPNVTIEISAAVTAAVTVEAAVYDLKIVAPNTKVIRLLRGEIYFSPEVTR